MFAALADATRRHLLDRLRADDGQTLVQLCTVVEMTRQAASKHLGVFERAGLIGKHQRARVDALAELTRQLEVDSDG